MRHLGAGLRDGVAAHVVLLSVAIELGLREVYHRVSAEALGFLLLGLVWVTVLGLLALRPRPSSMALRTGLGRMAVWAATGLAVHVLVVPGVAGLALPRETGSVLLLGAAVAATALLRWSFTASEEAWQRVRRALALGFIVFTASQLVFAAWRAPYLAWPPVERGASLGGDRSATVFLLLDELNASSAGPVVDLLRRRGLEVEARAIATVGGSTSKVVPEVFSGLRFEQAKPCGPTAICSTSTVLDFGRIAASRPDVDVVGFFHPYCAIRGLRSCERATIGSALWDPERWLCGLRRRTGLPPGLTAAHCSGVYNGVWSELTRETIAALWRAPVWQRGGLLFAHLPLPHPPGLDASSSLQRHYRDNIERAVGVIDEMLDRLDRAGLEPRLVIFSDHPLRQAHWCANYAPYAEAGCVPDPALQDDHVPLIVAGRHLPDTSAVLSNAQVFGLAAVRWR